MNRENYKYSATKKSISQKGNVPKGRCTKMAIKTDGLPRCKLVGTDGNVFSIIGNVSRTLKNQGLRNEAKEFEKLAFTQKSYEDVLRLASTYVEIF